MDIQKKQLEILVAIATKRYNEYDVLQMAGCTQFGVIKVIRTPIPTWLQRLEEIKSFN